MKALEKAKELQKDVKMQVGVAMAGAFAFIIAFSWNEFMKEAVNDLVALLGVQNAILLRFLAAIVATVIGVIGIRYFAKRAEST